MASITGPQRLRDKVCIVTGSSSGVGRAIALAYAREGGLLVCADLTPQARPEVSAERAVNTDELIRQNCGRAIFVQTDVSKAAGVENLVRQAVAEYGRLDVLVNNAGISLEASRAPTKIHETPEDVWDTTMAVNVKSIFLGCKLAIAQMLRQDVSPSGDRGWIINTSSVFGLVGGYYIRELPVSDLCSLRSFLLIDVWWTASYCASKGAVSNLTRQVALDYAESRIHCNAICPGYTETAIFVNTIKHHDGDEIREKHPLRGIGSPEDLVGAAIFLASDEARWITGVCLPVDGGYIMQ
ncbi:Uncharacterized protein TCAP_07260 [Tolypocladium capitatum]|uniref:Uncharacterized protein n=1 Tax=Tolypocladium capitatum TaxID=45235 RepID=A0A2K3Q165_9HYPO|nr:Uncharacterized protein TCAP_07260 [Tolypocladium capitatum]